MDRLRAMQIFLKVVECGSFTRAADALDLSNASVTEWIKNLEEHLGSTLIRRTSRHLSLTDEGTHFYGRSTAILAQMARAEAEVRGDAAAVSATIRVEATMAIGEALIAPLIPRFVALHPMLSVSMTLINTPRNMIEFGTDVALRVDYVESAELLARAAYEATHIACAAPDFLNRNPPPPSPRDLDPRLCLGLLSEGLYAPRPWRFARAGEQVERIPAGPLACSSTPVLLQAAEQEAGIVYVLDMLVASHLASGRLVRIFPDWEGERRTLYAVTPRTRFIAPKVRTFMHFLLDELNGGPAAQAAVPVQPRSRARRVGRK